VTVELLLRIGPFRVVFHAGVDAGEAVEAPGPGPADTERAIGFVPQVDPEWFEVVPDEVRHRVGFVRPDR
jgi:hypothetical protein